MKKIPKLNIEGNILVQIEQAGLWSEGKPLRLHLGCGEQHLEGYINIDYPPSEHTVQIKIAADIFADITTLYFPEQSVDEIRLHHVFEHFNRAHALAQLIRWHEWLKVGGKLHIETPDILGCARQLGSDIPYKIKQAVIRHLFGSHEADWAYHYDGWYDEKYRYILKKFGFNVECRSWHWQNEPFLANVEAIAIKYTHMSRRDLISVADEILQDSMVADASSERDMHGIWCREMRSFIEKNIHSFTQQELSADKTEMNTFDIQLGAIKIYPDTTETDSLGYDNDRPETNGEYHIISQLIKPGNTVFDVGANVGNWSRQVLSTNPDITLYAFEPVPELHTILKQNLGNSPDVNIHDIALSDKNGTRTFSYFNKSVDLSGMGSFYRRIGQEERLNLKPVQIQVNTQTLDYFCKMYSVSHIDFLKIDTEGAELDVIRGASNLLIEGHIRHLQFEYGGTYLDAGIALRDVCDLLSKHKYALFRIVPDGLIHISNWRDSLENYRYANYLAVVLCDSGKWTALKTESISTDELTNDTKNKDLPMLLYETNENEKVQLLERLQRDFRKMNALIRLAEIELQRSNNKKAKNYLIAALALEPQNMAAKTLWKKLQQG